MKRKIVFVFSFFSLAFLAGCTSVIELSDNENRAIAEYSAELLLKYSVGYESKYFEGEMEGDELQTTEAATVEAVEPVTNEPQSTSEAATEAPTEQAISYETDIAHAINQTNISILFNKYEILERYPGVEEEGAFVEAPSGMKLLVTEFNISNLTDAPLDVNLLDLNVDYYIVMNEEKTAKQMLTILMDDLSTYEATLEPGSSEKVVLVYQIADNLVNQIQSLDIKVNYEGSEKMIKVQ